MKTEILKELINIRCLLESICLDTKEAKDGTTIEHVNERVADILKTRVSEDEIKSVMRDLE